MKNLNSQLSSQFNNPRVIGLIAYITTLGWFVAFILNRSKNNETSFHLRQALGIHLLALVGSMLFIIPFFGWIAGSACSILSFVLWLYGFSLAWDEEARTVPFVGEQFQAWFKDI